MRALFLAALLVGCGSSEPRTITVVQTDGTIVEADPDCASGCLMPSESETPEVSHQEFAKLLEAYAASGPESDAIDALIFDGEQTRRLLARHGAGSLSQTHIDTLYRELDRDQARVQFRLIDEFGALRASLPAMDVAFGPGNHVPMIGGDALGHLLISGRVRRVGLHHLWTRW
jgi:hypothetical protein